MTTDENKTTNPVGSDDNQVVSNDANQADLMTGDDLSDIDLNLDGIELPAVDTDDIVSPVIDDEYIGDSAGDEMQEEILQPLKDLESIQEIENEEESGEIVKEVVEPEIEVEQLDELALDDMSLDLNESEGIESDTNKEKLDLEVSEPVNVEMDNIDSVDETEQDSLDLEGLEIPAQTDNLNELVVGDLGIEENIDDIEETVDPVVEQKEDESIEQNLDDKETVENNENYDWISMENQKVEEELSQDNSEEKSEEVVVEKLDTEKGLNQVDDFSDLFADTTSNAPQNVELTNAIESTENLIKDIEKQQEGFVFDTTNTNYEANNLDLDNIKNILNTEDSGPVDLVPPVAETSSKEEKVEVDTAPINSNAVNIDEIIKSSQFEKIEIGDVSTKQPEGVVSLDSLISDAGTATTVPQKVEQIENTVVLSSLSKKKKGAGLKLFILIVLLIFGGAFILKTMYPEEINDIISAIKNGNNIDIESLEDFEADNEVLGEETPQDEDLIDEVDPDSLAGQLESKDGVLEEDVNGEDSIENENSDLNNVDVEKPIDMDSGHGSADDFNAFESLDNLLGEDKVVDADVELLNTLGTYLQKGEEFQTWGRDNENQTAFKYGGFIVEYVKKFIEDIESGAEIDRSKIDEYISKFDIYLSRLNDLRNSNSFDE